MPNVQHSDQKTGDIAALLLAHYAVHARDLLWRKRPGQGRPDPYHVWLSEIMLQQTTVMAVMPYFARFTDRWKNFEELAACDDADLMAAWAGLGYYARARNLLKCARTVVSEHGGELPQSEDALKKLPGIGPYTAAAIAAIAFGQRAVVVDANIERVVSRLFALSTPLPQAKPEIAALMDRITPADRAGDFAQAMMDLGAGICSVKAPACDRCPLADACQARNDGNPVAYPVKQPKKARPVRKGTAYWIRRGDKVWLVRRKDSGMLAAMRALPDDGWSARSDGDGRPPCPADWRPLPSGIAHIFSHFSLELQVAVTAWPHGPNPPLEGEWWDVNSLDKAGLPTLFIKATKVALASGER
jgi:A/G-specific adenine glycosylase